MKAVLEMFQHNLFAFLLLILLVIFLGFAAGAYRHNVPEFAVWCTNKAGEVLAAFLTLAVASRTAGTRASDGTPPPEVKP